MKKPVNCLQYFICWDSLTTSKSNVLSCIVHVFSAAPPSTCDADADTEAAAVSQAAGSLDNLTIQDNQAADISALLAGGQEDGACSSLPTHYRGPPRQLRALRDGSRSLNQLEARLSGLSNADSNSETDSVFGEEEDMFMSDFMPRLVHETDDLSQLCWNWVAAGACTVDPIQPPNYW